MAEPFIDRERSCLIPAIRAMFSMIWILADAAKCTEPMIFEFEGGIFADGFRGFSIAGYSRFIAGFGDVMTEWC